MVLSLVQTVYKGAQSLIKIPQTGHFSIKAFVGRNDDNRQIS